MLQKTSEGFESYSTLKQKGALKEIKRVVSELLNDTTPLMQVDLNWLEMRRNWVEIVSEEVLEAAFCDQGEIKEMLNALYRVSCAVYRAQMEEKK